MYDNLSSRLRGEAEVSDASPYIKELMREAADSLDNLCNCVLKIAAVKDARWERTYKGTTFQELADRYGVSKKTMQNAINGVTWKCVPYYPEPPKEEA